MAKIVSIGPSQSPIKRLWKLFQSFESFTKVTILTSFLIILATPFIVGNRQIFNPKAEKQVAQTSVFVPEPLAVDLRNKPVLVPDQYIVVFKDDQDPVQGAKDAERAHGVRRLHTYQHALKGFSFRGSSQAASALSKNPKVKFVSQDQFVYSFAQTLPTGIDRVDADTNPIAKIDGIDERVNVNVAIIDTGIDIDHPDLNVVGGKDCTDSGSFDDIRGHGTSVAGVVGALDNSIGVVGVAPGARLWAVRRSSFLSASICGIDWVAGTRTDADSTNDIAVANMSWGGMGTVDNNCGLTNNDALHQAICNMVAVGVVPVAAVNNMGQESINMIPGNYTEVLLVSAIADSDGEPGGLGPSTSSGPDDTFATFSDYGAAVDIAAPGVKILTTVLNGGYGEKNGASMAAPHVAGAVALYVAANGLATNAVGVAAIRQAITDPANGYSVAQNSPNGFTGDRDSYPEPLVFLSPLLPPPPPSLPTVTTSSASDVSSSSATLNGAANPNNGATTGWFRYSATNPGSCNDAFGIRVPSSGGTALGAGTTPVPYAYTISGLTSSTTYYFCAVASNSAGTGLGSIVSFTTTSASLPDTTPPSTSIISPLNGATVSGTITVSVSATDNVGVTSAELYLDGALVGTDLSSPYEFVWDTTQSTNGSHTLQSKAYDAAGNSSSSSIVTVTVSNIVSDTTPPSVSITSPLNEATVKRGSTITISATATDNIAVSKVEFYVKAFLQCTDTSAPYSCSWEVPGARNKTYELQANAYDAAGNVGASSVITVTSE